MSNNLKTNINKSLSVEPFSILNQLPGYVIGMDTNNKFNFFVNERTADLIGYNDPNEVYERDINEMRCKAAEATDVIIEQNNQIIKELKTLKVLDIHPYRNDEVKMLLSQKSPFLDASNNPIGVLYHAIEITQQSFFNISSIVANNDKKYHSKNNTNQRSYTISDSLNNKNLTDREMECLFYYIRGKTCKQLAAILSISKRTAEKHLANIKSKLNCFNKSQLIEYAIINNFIDYIPEKLLSGAHMNISIII